MVRGLPLGFEAGHCGVAQAMARVTAIVIEKDRISHDRATPIVQLETALESRVTIEQAKGILLGRLHRGRRLTADAPSMVGTL